MGSGRQLTVPIYIVTYIPRCLIHESNFQCSFIKRFSIYGCLYMIYTYRLRTKMR